jgi:hypothetical protein
MTLAITPIPIAMMIEPNEKLDMLVSFVLIQSLLRISKTIWPCNYAGPFGQRQWDLGESWATVVIISPFLLPAALKYILSCCYVLIIEKIIAKMPIAAPAKPVTAAMI